MALFQTWLLIPLALLTITSASNGSSATATIIDSGSTNRRGARVTVDESGNARLVVNRGGAEQQLKLPEKLCAHLLDVLASSRPLQNLPARNCAKSVSFGSKLFIEFEGERSPDLSCPGQTDEHVAALQKAANEILQAARQHDTQQLIR